MYNNLKIFLVSLKALSKKENLVGRKGISSNSRVNLKILNYRTNWLFVLRLDQFCRQNLSFGYSWVIIGLRCGPNFIYGVQS